MEEDIKLLEEKINEYHINIFDNRFLIIYEKEIQAIENLINRNKELEEENTTLKKGVKRLKDKSKELSEELIDVKVDKVTKNFIPKSKVKEKIEELNDYDSKFCQRVLDHNEHTLTELIQNILQELLEE